ncbi:putative alcohol dehydrogenase [Lyophyllum shimeji]|uniref:Alcohol dehydrogenase n=1 Tax=Lyophyllum shimeji TaxID=47721 RepID=A0A9P3PUK3_LYOSH|nr:putative alcohol dehydrogenase [Lyophyllum shimeji]
MATNIPATVREYHIPTVGSIDNLAIRTKKVEQPKPTEVLVKIYAVSLQHRDLDIAQGTYPMGAIPDVVPCSDMAGQVVAVGEDVKYFKPGDRVCANFTLDHIAGDVTPEMQQTSLGGQTQGVLTEYRVFPCHSLVKFPDHLSYEEASTLPCAALTAYNALMGPKPLKAGDCVLTLGTGGVSTFGLQLAVASGAVVIATSSHDEKLNHQGKLGAKHLINYKKTPDWEREVLRLTGGRGVDHVIEVGGAATLPRSVQAARMGGSIHLIGYVAKEEIDPAGILPSIFTPSIFRGTTLRGVYIGSVESFQAMNRLIAACPDKTRPVVDKVFGFDQAKEAYKHLKSQAHIGKVVIKVANA